VGNKQKGKKTPFAAQVPEQAGKVPRAIPGTSSYQQSPSWRVGALEMVDPYGWHEIDACTLLRIHRFLSNLESMTWAEILIKGKKHHHSVSVSKICAAAQQRLADLDLVLDDLVSLALSNTERIYGYLVNGVLFLLWWDPCHQVYPVEKRNT
jgi:hypothetical protein